MECNGQNMLGMKTTKMGKKCLKKTCKCTFVTNSDRHLKMFWILSLECKTANLN